MTFVTTGSAFYSEEYNGAIFMFSQSSYNVTLMLPFDYVAGDWYSGQYLADFIVVITSLSDTQIKSDGSGIELAAGKTTGTALIRVYPNIEPFKQWGVVEWTKTTPGASTIVCDLKKDFGATLVDDNISSGHDLSGDGLIHEYIDFLFTLTADGINLPTLDTFTLSFSTGE